MVENATQQSNGPLQDSKIPARSNPFQGRRSQRGHLHSAEWRVFSSPHHGPQELQHQPECYSVSKRAED